MIRSVKLENEFNQSIELIGNNQYTLTNIKGLNPAPATINTTSNSGYDGSRYDSSRVGNRNIVLSVAIEYPVEKNRIELYKYARPKRYIKFYYKNGLRDVYIEGYVESCELNPFSQKTTVQISIICPQPYFCDMNSELTTFGGIVNLFEFPFSNPVEGMAFSGIIKRDVKTITNYGDIECGLIFKIEALGNIVEPTIYNADTPDKFGLNIELLAGDKLTINTNDRAKSVQLERAGVTTNVVNNVMRESKWLKLPLGAFKFTYDAVYGSENIALTIQHNDLYQGV